jgi:hypothetical protein
MQVLSLNGVDLSKGTTDTLSAALKMVTTDTMELELYENKALFKTYSTPSVSASGGVGKKKGLGGRIRGSVHVRKVATTRRTVVVQKGSGGFGVKFGGAAAAKEADKRGYGVFVAGMKAGGEGKKVEGLEIGMQVLKVNGTDMKKATTKELDVVLKAAKKTGELTLELETNEELYEAYNTKKRVVKTTLTKGPDGLGFGILFGGPKNKAIALESGFGVYVFSCKKGGVASQNPEIQEDLQIMSVNGKDTSKATLTEFATILGTIQDTIELQLAPNIKLSTTYNAIKAAKKVAKETGDSGGGGGGDGASPVSSAAPILKAGQVAVSLKKGPDGFGLSFGGATKESEITTMGVGVFIAGIKAGGVAEGNVDIKVGMQIVSIGENDVTECTLKDLPKIFATIQHNCMNLLLQPNAALFARGVSVRTKGAAVSAASAVANEEPPPTTADYYAGWINNIACSNAITSLGVGHYLVNKTSNRTFNLIIADDKAVSGCTTIPIGYSASNGKFTSPGIASSGLIDVVVEQASNPFFYVCS